MEAKAITAMVCLSEGMTLTIHTTQMNPFKQAAPFIAPATAPLFLVIAVATAMAPKAEAQVYGGGYGYNNGCQNCYGGSSTNGYTYRPYYR